jgi:hypothetical protein
MALDNGMRGGGIYYDVGLRFDQLDRDLDALAKRLKSEGSSLSVGVSGSGGGGGNTLAIAGGVAAIVGEFRGLAQTMARGLDGVIDQLRSVAKSTATVAGDVIASGKVAHDFRREERRQFHTAQAGRLGSRALGQSRTIESAEGYARLPADVRIAGGVGFDKMLRAQKASMEAAAAPVAAQAAQEAIVPVVRELMDSAKQVATKAADQAGRTTKAGGYAMRPGPEPKDAWSVSPYDLEGEQRGAPLGGNMAGFAQQQKRRGMMAIPDAAEIERAIALMGKLAASAHPVGRGMLLAWEGSRRLHAGISSVGHVGALTFNRLGAAPRRVELAFNRLVESTRFFRNVASGAFSAVTFPIRVALRHLDLFDHRVGLGTNSLRLMGRVGLGLTAPLTLPFRAASGVVSSFTASIGHALSMVRMMAPVMTVAFVGRGVKGAMDLNETLNMSREVFGGFSTDVEAFADEYANRFGIVKQASIDAAAGFGSIGQAAGMTKEESSQLGIEFAKLATDLASFRNLSFEEAQQKISSGLVGEAEPLRKVGVLLDEDAVKARAMAMGLAAATGELSRQDKVVARAALIRDGLSAAQGDMERTSGSSANMMRRLAGDIQNAGVAVGQTLEPAFRQILLLYNDLRVAGGSVGSFIMDTLSGIGRAIAGSIRFVRQLVTNWDDTRELIGLVFQQLVENAGFSISWLGQSFMVFFDWFGSNWRTIFIDAFNLVATGLSNIGQNISDFIASFMAWIQDPLNNSFDLRLTPILEGFEAQTPTLELPEFTLPNTYADEMGEVLSRIFDTALPGDEEVKNALPKPGELLPGEEATDKGKSRVGELIGAREMLSLLQGNASEKQKDSKNLERIAGGIDRLVEKAEKPKGVVPVAG